MSQCTARSKRSGERCRRAAIINRTTCYNHGGTSPVGIGSATFQTGRYSKHLPTKLIERFRASDADPDLLALRSEISLIDARLEDVLRRVETSESGQLWRDLRAAYEAASRAQRAGDPARASVHLAEVGSLITRGHADYAAWTDICLLIEQRRRLVESERKRLVDMQAMLTSEQAMAFLSSVIAAVSAHVRDPAIRKAIAADISRFTPHDVR
jgi:hypothetical protein